MAETRLLSDVRFDDDGDTADEVGRQRAGPHWICEGADLRSAATGGLLVTWFAAR